MQLLYKNEAARDTIIRSISLLHHCSCIAKLHDLCEVQDDSISTYHLRRNLHPSEQGITLEIGRRAIEVKHVILPAWAVNCVRNVIA